ncbi:MAG: cyclic pyranopterin monophosphate synthase MoaC [Candidatus Helarchaeota archaeon]|nr:cyclic pyranopterin monophosphate synthase MoaC [Candidatus Helarchaeota archaeon]
MKTAKIRMAEISSKNRAYREATAEGTIYLKKTTIDRIKNYSLDKGDPIHTAEIAGILAAKQTPQLIPLCHPIPITNVQIDISMEENLIKANCTVKSLSRTGVEMEALTGVSIALLTIWDMVKPLEKDLTGQYPTTKISNIRVVKKIKKNVEKNE